MLKIKGLQKSKHNMAIFQAILAAAIYSAPIALYNVINYKKIVDLDAKFG